MGTYKEDDAYVTTGQDQEPKKILKVFIACLWSFLISMAGGLILGYWEYEYHLTSSQLWMVPFGLILLVTPVIIWTALVVSEICNPKEDDSKNKSIRCLNI